jgi:Raf kinase inhibitor-like YbhB/YbcL family protein
MKLSSTSFAHNGSIPKLHTCQGADRSPHLSLREVPPQTKSLALIVDDPDAPDPKAPKTTWVHWILYNIPPDTSELPEGVKALPPGTRPGKNDWKRISYGGPCPPIGRHRYFFKLYALDTLLPDLSEPTKPALETAMRGHILAQSELIGTYQKN